MARTEIEHIVPPSLLDRLTDLEPKVSIDAPTTQEASERLFKRGVARDVEFLLNTRRTMYPAPDNLPELRASMYDFGLPDTTGIPVGTETGRARLVDSLRDTLTRFEPRLANVRVRLTDAEQVRSPQVRFVIEATLVMDRDRQQVVFDTVLEIASGEYDVRAADDASASP